MGFSPRKLIESDLAEASHRMVKQFLPCFLVCKCLEGGRRARNGSMQDQIEIALSELEATESVTILYACESGSRAWGFASSDSDYDVRFLSLRPPSWRYTEPRRGWLTF